MQDAAQFLRSGQFPAAIEAYQKILKASPRDLKVTLGLAAAYRGVFNYDETRRLLRQVSARYPKSAAALVELGKLDIHQQRYDDAIEHLTQAVRRQPSLPAAHEQLGVAYQAKGDDATALKHLSEAVRLDPHSASAHYFRGSLYADHDDYVHAYQDAQEADRIDPNAQTRVLLAKAATHTGKCDEAVTLLKPVSESESADPANLYLLSRAYKCAGQPDLAQQAQDEFEARSKRTQEIRTQKMDADHLATQAGELARKNQLAEAMDLLHQALAKDPENGPTLAVLAKIDFSRGDVAKAKDEITTALRSDPYNPDYLYVLGKVLEKQSDANGALQAFQQIVLVNPKESDAYFEMGEIYLQKGERARGFQALKKAVELSPDDPDYQKAFAQAGARK
jgi:tetratricopeptide (TPR) repeat protein